MTPLYYLAEIAATLTENVVAISAVTAAAGQRYQGKKHLAVIWLLAATMVIPITILNMIQAFSYVTIVTAMISVIAVTKLSSTGNLLVRSTACITAYLIIHTIGYTFLFCFGLVFYDASTFHTFDYFMSFGPLRAVFILTGNSLVCSIYFLCRRYLKGLADIPYHNCKQLLVTSSGMYITMSVLLNLIVEESWFDAQVVAIYAWLLILFSTLLILVVIHTVSNYQNERRSNELLQMTNALMTQNYRELHQEQQTFSRQLHDFKHHLMALRGLLSAGKGGEAEDYLDSLLDGAYREARQCHSGSDIIDAILNCKLAQARLEGIDFSFEADFPLRTNLLDADICGVLANQLDNAFDACRRLPADKPREIRAEVRQVRSFAFFQVENSVAENPLLHNRELRSTKQDGSPLHGIGLRSIREIADKYDGSVRHEYKDGRFLSVVTLCFEEAER